MKNEMTMKTLLIADDNIMMREFLKNYFSAQYKVEVFESGEAIMYHMKAGDNPDAIILDHDMDGMNGQEVLRSIKSSVFHKDIPVILLSGKKESDTRISCLKYGAQDFITKPFNPMELDLKIQKVMHS